jgi:hypothetical protein
MNNGNNTKNNVVRGKRGWNRREFRWDKSSPEYKEYLRKYKESMSKKARRRLEELAKKPLPGKVYKSNN